MRVYFRDYGIPLVWSMKHKGAGCILIFFFFSVMYIEMPLLKIRQLCFKVRHQYLTFYHQGRVSYESNQYSD